MPVARIREGESIGAARGDTVVAIPVFGALEEFSDCLRSVLEHADRHVAVVIADDATPGDAVGVAIAALSPANPVYHLRREQNAGFVASVNAVLDVAAPADLAVLNSDCVVGPGWLDGLRAAAASDSRVATASALGDRASILSVPGASAMSVREDAQRLRPRIPTAIGHCFYLKREAVELVGKLDPAFAPGYGEEVDFSQRCVLNGLVHVAADDVYVVHREGGSFGARARELREAHERIVERRYPYYAPAVRAVATAERGPLHDALAAARRSARGLSVTIDASALGPVTMGTQVTTLALIRALASIPDIRLRVALPRASSAALDAFGVERIHLDEIEQGVPRTDIVHRPSQPIEPKQLDWLHRLGDRIVITHQDLIGFQNPGYFSSYETWNEHRTLTRQTLALADAVVFVSQYVRREALAEQLVTPERAHVVAQGVDHPQAQPEPPAGAPERFVVCLGTDFLHKNRLFALRLFDAMRARGYEGCLVLAGPEMPYGSSRAQEDDHLRERPDLSRAVIRLGQVSEREKAWLYRNADLVVYPTVSEGFGLVPFEAARAGTPCVFAPQSSLVEVAGSENATIVPWDAAASADNALRLLDEPRALVDGLGERAARWTWSATAASLLDVYRNALERPQAAARAIYFGEAISDVALSLVGPGGHLPPDVQRALLAVSTRPALKRPVFGLLTAAYRALRHR